jgi:hypothetical protein
MHHPAAKFVESMNWFDKVSKVVGMHQFSIISYDERLDFSDFPLFCLQWLIWCWQCFFNVNILQCSLNVRACPDEII